MIDYTVKKENGVWYNSQYDETGNGGGLPEYQEGFGYGAGLSLETSDDETGAQPGRRSGWYGAPKHLLYGEYKLR